MLVESGWYDEEEASTLLEATAASVKWTGLASDCLVRNYCDSSSVLAFHRTKVTGNTITLSLP